MSTALLSRPGRTAFSNVSFDDGDDMEVQLAELRSDVRHIQTDVSDIKVAGRSVNHERPPEPLLATARVPCESALA